MKDVYRAYYTKSEYITSYMVSMINPKSQERILEPCGGDGMFIDAILQNKKNVFIDTCELNSEAANKLRTKYLSNEFVSIRETDTLLDKELDEYSFLGYYDKIIGNPPYGGWQEFERRDELKKKYNGFYVRETYSLFLLRCISVLKENGILSFIIPDTFLFLNNHKELRKHLLTNTQIQEITIFPSKFFPGVSFGYSNLCIISLKKSTDKSKSLRNKIKVYKGFKSDSELESLQLKQVPSHLSLKEITQEKIFNNDNHSFLLNDDTICNAIENADCTLAELADCVTGIYCGDNKRFLYLSESSKTKKNGYEIAPLSETDFNCNDLKGVNPPFKFVPIVKGSSKSKFIRTSDEWVIDWSREAIHYYNNEKKARFQNSKYYFKRGIALPMVKSANIKATIMYDSVFDQSIVGVFAKNENLTHFLLAYLNSKIANDFIHTINPTANNSANYLKKLPLFMPSQDETLYVNNLVETIFEQGYTTQIQEEIDSFFFNKLIKQ